MMEVLQFVFLLGLVVVGYGKLTVHVVCHTHDDTGWLWTVDQYYMSDVRFILDTVVAALDDEPRRKFNYVEMAFFARWWQEATAAQKEKVKRLVKNQQLEFLNGGWCMHDEATPMYNEMVDQTTRGHQFILKEFGPDAAPKSTWQIDAFGHTNTQAWLLAAEAGMPSMFWGRMDDEDRAARRKSRNLEYIWRGSKTMGEDAEIFAGAIWGNAGKGIYNCPFNFDQYDLNSQVQGNPALHDYNVGRWAKIAVDKAMQQATESRTDHIMFACGMDFNYKNAYTWFRNLEAIMDKVNQDGQISMIYSSPRQYVDAIYKEKEKYKFEVRTDDLVPFHWVPHNYWNGYYSSRVAFKRLLRYSWNLLYVARQVDFFVPVSPQTKSTHRAPKVGVSWTDQLEAAVSLGMHHDAISGTAKQNVNGDYAQRISEGQAFIEDGMDLAMRTIFNRQDASFQYCPGLNISLCTLTTDRSQNGGFSVVAWNPRGQTARHFLFQIPVHGKSGFKVLGSNAQFQLLKIDPITSSLPLLYINSFGLSEADLQQKEKELSNNATHVLVFQADIPPVGFSSFNVVPVPLEHTSMAEETSSSSSSSESDKFEFDNGVYRIAIDPSTKEITSITNLKTGTSTKLSLNWGWYEAADTDCTNTGCQEKSGSDAYQFRPNSPEFHYPGPQSTPMETEIIDGPVVTEIRQKLSSFVYHVVRLTKGVEYVEVEYTVGPVSFENEYLEDKTKAKRLFGKEVVLRYETDLFWSNETFYTDSNGLEMIERVRDSRPQSYPQSEYWKDEPIASNYYPVNSMISISDGGRAFTVVTDSTQGGSSLKHGQLELMIHRRTLRNFRGVQEPLNETMCGCNGQDEDRCYCAGLAIRGVHRLVFGQTSYVKGKARQVSSQLQFQPLTFFTSASDIPTVSKSQLVANLPENVHLLTLNANYDKKLLIRLQHLYAANEHPELSKPVSIQLQTLLSGVRVRSAEELTLTGNLPIEKKYTYNWTRTRARWNNSTFNKAALTVTLKPMEIRTFLLETFAELY